MVYWRKPAAEKDAAMLRRNKPVPAWYALVAHGRKPMAAKDGRMQRGSKPAPE
ncbi:hypothetical protein FLA_6099 [Filimonas lacunae]|nr:hypothetical protein FLA_6099 [Filimonas lacunae]